jgi:pSer/pThr/pTyr-binding forkhead associated (FHA) protein
MAIIVVELQPAAGLKRSLDGGATIGRAEECNVRLEDPMVSRHHALVVDRDGEPQIEDLGSANGLYVNGRRHRGSVPLHPGDIVQLGATIWVVASQE